MNISNLKCPSGYSQKSPTRRLAVPLSRDIEDSVALGQNPPAGSRILSPKLQQQWKTVVSDQKQPADGYLSPEEQQAWREKLGDVPLRKGQGSSETVLQLKEFLSQRELVNLPEDGDFELFTENVVKGAQLRRGLPQTGVFDLVTREALLSGPKRDPLRLTPSEKELWNESFGDKPLKRGTNDKNHVRHLQIFLNERELESLTVDGDFGGQTEQAVKAAQFRQGLKMTGVFDQDTRRKLLDATKNVVDKGGTHEAVLGRIQDILRAEHQRFGGQTVNESGSVTKRGHREYEAGFDKRVGDYWKSIGLNFDGDDRDVPWSAAFISYAHRMAGVGVQFKAGPAHASYIRDSIFAKRDGLTDAAYFGHRPSERAPQVGDLVGRARQSGVDYDNQPSSYKSHTDLVVEVGKGFIKMMGGNVADSVSLTTVGTDEKGFINNRSRYFVVMEPNNLAGDELQG
jgi:peptidoglycan hydrolase-like protein with peptidoglycan-binding domain